MIYQIGIGEFDNCYIITGGITGLTSFLPTEIDGTSDPVVISIDSEKDDITSTWIKQSLRVNVIKTSSAQFLDVIDGNDNETFGVLIEGGYLYLSGGELLLSNGAKLKFIGTLTLESYVEDYKSQSVVSFTFFDKIGKLNDDTFYTDKQYKTFPDIVASLVNDVSCSERIKIEWPYSIEGSELPHSLKLLIETHDGSSKIDVLQKVLGDFFLQLYVDFEDMPSAYLTSCGCVKIRSISGIPSDTVKYYRYAKYTYTSLVCAKTYYYYDYVTSELISRPKTDLNTYSIPLINADSKLSLDRIASSVVATTQIVERNLVFRGEVDKAYSKKVPYGRPGQVRLEYCPFGYYSARSDKGTPVDDIKALLSSDNLNALRNPGIGSSGVIFGNTYAENQVTYYRMVLSRQSLLSYQDFHESNLKIVFKVDVNNPGALTCIAKPNILLKIGNSYYINDGSSWEVFTSMDQLYTNNGFDLPAGESTTYEKKLTIPAEGTGNVTLMAAILYSIYQGGVCAVTKISIETELEEVLPDKQILTTTLPGNNRKVISIEPTFMNKPNVINAAGIVDNLISTTDYYHPLTITYDNTDQALIAHISDQYGWQYESNKWNLEATIEAYQGQYPLNERYTLDDMKMIIVNGDYSAKRRELTGKWCQVLKPNPIFLLQDNYIPFKWDNGNLIKLG